MHDQTAATRPKKRKAPARDWKVPFLEELANNGGCIIYACEAVGISRPAVYQARMRDEDFAVDMQDAMDYAKERLISSAYKRAVDGDTLLTMFFIKKLDPSFRDNWKANSGFDDAQIQLLVDIINEATNAAGLDETQKRQFGEVLGRRMKVFEESAT
jgi:hypothetical protein